MFKKGDKVEYRGLGYPERVGTLAIIISDLFLHRSGRFYCFNNTSFYTIKFTKDNLIHDCNVSYLYKCNDSVKQVFSEVDPYGEENWEE